MEFFEVVSKRRSVRKFLPEPVPGEVIEKALDAALKAPTSSNIQAWEFYWVKTPEKKEALARFCYNQSPAKMAQELIVAVSRIDTWKRNRNLLLDRMRAKGPIPKIQQDYYGKVVPLCYVQGPLGILGLLKWPIFNFIGLFKPAPRTPVFRKHLFEVVTKSTALACENLMLALVAQGYDSCPMEGFDEDRVKKLLGLGRKAHIVMVLGIGKRDDSGVYGEQIRLDKKLFLHQI